MSKCRYPLSGNIHPLEDVQAVISGKAKKVKIFFHRVETSPTACDNHVEMKLGAFSSLDLHPRSSRAAISILVSPKGKWGRPVRNRRVAIDGGS